MSEPHKTLGTPGGVGQPQGDAHAAPAGEKTVGEIAQKAAGENTHTVPANNSAHTVATSGTASAGATSASSANVTPANAQVAKASVAPAQVANNTPAGTTNNAPAGVANHTNNNPQTGAAHNNANPAEQKIQFHSAQTSQAVKPKDYFAEQNAKQAEKNQASAKTRKRLLIIFGAIAGVVIVALVAWLVVWLNSEPEVTYTGETIYFNDETIAENIVDLRKLAQNAFNKTGDNNDNDSDGESSELGNDIVAAEVVFAHALSVPENKNYASQINLAKELFYQNNGYYEQLLENKDKVNPNDLTAEQRAAYYNAISMAYYYTGDKAKSEEYMRLTQDAQRELGEFGG